MSGRFTRKMYDGCAYQQDTKQSTDPLELVLDVTKFVHCNNICKPAAEYPPNGALLVDVESSLWGIDKLASDCDTAKHPFCGPNGCLLTNDARVPPHITPYACERGKDNENAVITTNMKMPTDPGFSVPDANICNNQGNGYYYNPNKTPTLVPGILRPPQTPMPPSAKAPTAPRPRAPFVYQRPPTVAPQMRPPIAPLPNAPQFKPPVAPQRAPLAPQFKPPIIVQKAPLAPFPKAPLAPFPKAPVAPIAKAPLAPYPAAPKYPPVDKPITCIMPINDNLLY